MGDDEIGKLKTLLKYWIAHNEEHSQEFREWAQKAKARGEAEAGADMLEAAKSMDEANEPLLRALTRLGGGE